MHRMGRFARLGVLLTALLVATAEAGPRASQVNFGSEGVGREFRDAVEIGNDSGGYVAEYALRLYGMREARQRVRFVGLCDSACTLFLALPPEQTCITERAYQISRSLGPFGVRRRFSCPMMAIPHGCAPGLPLKADYPIGRDDELAYARIYSNL